jgi:hypothetical protein
VIDDIAGRRRRVRAKAESLCASMIREAHLAPPPSVA